MKERLWQMLRMGASWLLRRYANTTWERLQVEGAKFYIRGVDKLRLAFIAVLGGLLVLGLALAGLVLLPLSVVWFLELKDYKAGLVVFGFVLVYFGFALSLALALTSERNWMRFFHVDEVLARVIEHEQQ